VKVPRGENLQLNTDLADNTLTISGKVESAARDDDASGQLIGQAESVSQFSQSITLDDPVDEAGMKVDRDGGDIVITIPKQLS
jgi:HSP20 family molecular chaperone IbpA